MSTVANLLAQKERLMEQLERDAGPNERAEIEKAAREDRDCA